MLSPFAPIFREHHDSLRAHRPSSLLVTAELVDDDDPTFDVDMRPGIGAGAGGGEAGGYDGAESVGAIGQPSYGAQTVYHRNKSDEDEVGTLLAGLNTAGAGLGGVGARWRDSSGLGRGGDWYDKPIGQNGSNDWYDKPIAPPKTAPLFPSPQTHHAFPSPPAEHGHTHAHPHAPQNPHAHATQAPSYRYTPPPLHGHAHSHSHSHSLAAPSQTQSQAPTSHGASSTSASTRHAHLPDAGVQALAHLSALQGLLEPMAEQIDDAERLRKEVDMWRGEWQKADRERKRLEAAATAAAAVSAAAGQAVPPGPTFSAVLLDGDGLIFQDDLLKAGFAGGQTAAKRLLSALPSMLAHASISPTAQGFGTDITLGTAEDGDCEREAPAKRDVGGGGAIVHVFVNKSGLGNTLVKAGIVPAWGVYEAFMQGFSAAHELFSVIDVGPGKEASDAKIREHLRLYARHAQCEMIVLGASHDNGYANILSSLSTEDRLSKLLLLKGYNDLAGQLRQYSSRVVTIPDLFRTTKIPQSFSSVAAAPAAGSGPGSTVPGSAAAAAAAKKAKSAASAQTPALAAASTTATTTTTASKSTKAAAKSASKAAASAIAQAAAAAYEQSREHGHGGHGQITESDWESESNDAGAGASPSQASTDVYEWTVQSRRKDKESGAGAGAAAKTKAFGAGAKTSKDKDKGKEYNGYINTNTNNKDKDSKYSRRKGQAVRELHPRPCHTYYLSDRGCRNGEDCGYAHHYDLNADEVAELGRLAKEMVCPYVRGNKCHFSDDECVYGHRCPRMDDCKFCRFRPLPNGHGEQD